MKKILTLALSVSMTASCALPAAAATASSVKTSGSSASACSIDITSPSSETIKFYSSISGSSAPNARTVKVKNTGTDAVTLSQPSASSYKVGKLSTTKLSSGKTATFTVRPKSGLKSGTYNRTIKINATNGSSSTEDDLKVKYTVSSLSLSTLAKRFISTAKKYIGCTQGDSRHRDLVDTFNTVKPDGYPMTYTAPWCATFVSAIAIKIGLKPGSFPMSYNCGTLVDRAKKMGTWVENDNYMPGVGDYIIYYWGDSGYGDCTRGADHVGVVSGVSGSTFYVIEGNKSTTKSCGVRSMKRNGRYIRGFIKFNVKSSSSVNTDSDSSSSNAKVYAKGVVDAEDGVNVRSGAGTGYSVSGGLNDGTSVKCYDVKKAGGYTWWAINASKTRWIAADFVKITKIYDSSKVSGNSTSTVKVIDTGVVTSKTGLAVRKGAGTSCEKAGELKYNAKVSCYAKKTVNGRVWWAINSSKTKWVSTKYIKAASDKTASKTEDSTAAKVITTGTVTSKTGLTVRKGAGTSYDKDGKLKYGDKVSCYAKKTVNGATWWAVNSSKTRWVNAKFVKDASEKTDDSTAKIITTGTVTSKTGLTVRKGAGTSYDKDGKLKYGDKVSCYAKKTVNGATWWAVNSSKTRWVNAKFVKDASGKTDDSTAAKVITTGTVTSKTGLTVRKGAGTSYDKDGKLKYGDKVSCYAKKTVNGATWWAVNSSKTRWVNAKFVKDASEKTDDSTAKVITTGTVTSKTGLTVRKGAGTSYDKDGKLKYGDKVSCYAKKTVNGTTWWAVNSSKTRWVNAKFVKTSSSSEKTESTTSSKGCTIKIVTSRSGVLVRKGPGTKYAHYDGGYDYKDKVRCYAEKNGWTAVNKSHTKWVCSKYLKNA